MIEDRRLRPQGIRLAVPRPDHAEATYRELLPTIVTTFNMPQHESHLEMVEVDTNDLVARLPFHAFAVREPFIAYAKDNSEKACGTETVLLSVKNDAAIVASRIDYALDNGTRMACYCPCLGDEQSASALTTLRRLYIALYCRRSRFIETPVSRQVRRSENRPVAYREYVVVQPTSPLYERALRPSAIMRRMRSLHAVRGHERHLASGRITWVASHSRGIGHALQVKDYHLHNDSATRVHDTAAP